MYKNRIYGKILFIIVSENIKYPGINLIVSNKSNRLIRINLINTFNKIFVKTLCSWNSPAKNTGVGCPFPSCSRGPY